MSIPPGDTGTAALVGLWQSTASPVTRVRLTVTDGTAVLFDLPSANRLGNALCDLVAEAGIR